MQGGWVEKKNTKPTTTTTRLPRSDVVSEERQATAAIGRPYPVRRRSKKEKYKTNNYYGKASSERCSK